MAKDTVDTRVVRMEFDNKQFEKNIKQTSKSLDNLKQNLDFKGVGDSLEKVRVKISALQIAATTFVVNLTNRLIHLGTTLVKSLSVDNISAGWAKFGEKTISVATMMAQKIRIAGEEITDLAKKTEAVNQALEKLAWFSDETSYSFTNMTDSVGKFIATGQDLDKSVKAIEGIATWAAMAGQNSMTASMAMTQLAQALGAGSIKLQDWKSIENYHMDMEIFKEAVLETAVSLGQLTKEGDKFVTKTGKKFDQSSFRQYLSEGWFTSDVLIDTLNKYSAAVDDIYRLSEETGLTASQVIEKYGDQLDEFGVKAFKASQDARTFADVLNYIKDAVASKWMTTFETIFGNQEEAVKLWTSLSEELYDVFVESGNFRNNILSVWKNFGGRDDIFGEHGEPNQGAFWNLYDAIIAVRDLISKAWNTVFPISMMENASDRAEDIGRQLKDLTRKIRDFTNSIKVSSEWAQRISKTFQIIFTVLKTGAVVLKTIRFIIDPIIELAKQLVGQVLDQVLYSTNQVLNISERFEALAVKLQSAIVDLLESLNAPEVLDEVFAFIRDVFKLISDLHPIETLIRFVGDFIDSFKKAGGTSENFIKIIKSVLSAISLVRKIIISLVSVIITTVLPVLDDIIDILVKIAGFILGTAVKVVSIIAEMITSINNALQGNGNAEEFKNEIFDLLDQLGKLAKSLIPIVGSLITIILKLVEVVLLIPKMLNELSKQITGKGILENLNSLFDGIIAALSDFVNGVRSMTVKGQSTGFFKALTIFFNGIWEFLKGIIASSQILLVFVGKALENIGIILQKIANFFINVFSGELKLSKWNKILLNLIALAALLAIIGVVIYNLFYHFAATIHPIGRTVEAITDTLDAITLQLKSSIFTSFARALLEISVAIGLLAVLDPDRVKLATVVLLIFVTALSALVIAIQKVGTTATSFKKVIAYADKSIDATEMKDNSLLQFAFFIRQFAKAVLRIAIALAIVGRLSKTDLEKGIVVLGGIFAAIVALIFIIKESDSKLSGAGSVAKDIAKMIIAISVSMLALVGAIALISKLSDKDLKKGMMVFAALVAAIVIIAKVLNTDSKKIKYKESKGDFQKFAGIALMLTSLSLAIATLTASLLILSRIKAGPLWMAVGVIATIAAITTGLIVLVDKAIKGENSFQKFAGIAIMMAGIAHALLGIALAILMLSKLSWDQMVNPLKAIAIVLGTLTVAVFALTRDNKGSSVKKGQSVALILAGMTGALVTLGGVLIALSFIPWQRLIAPVAAIVIVIGSLTGAVSAIQHNNKGASSKKAANTLLMLGGITSMVVALGGVLMALSFMPWNQLLTAAGSMSLMIGSLTAAIILMSKNGTSSYKKAGQVVLMLGGLVTACVTLALAVKILATMPWNVMLIAMAGLLGMISGLALITIALSKLSNSASIAANMITISVALGILGASLMIFTPALKKFSEIDMSSIGKGFLVIAGSIIVLGIAAVILKSVVPIIAVLAGALLTLGVALLAAGIGIKALAEGMQAMNGDMGEAIENLSTMLSMLLDKITESVFNLIDKLTEHLLEALPTVLELLAQALMAFFILAMDKMDIFVEFVITVIDAICTILDEKGPMIIHTVVTLITTLLSEVSKNAKSIATSIVNIFVELLSAVEARIEELTHLLNNIVVGIIQQLGKDIGPIVGAVFDLLKKLTEAVFESGKLDALIYQITKDVTLFTMKVILGLMAWTIPLSMVLTAFILELIAQSIAFAIISLGAVTNMVLALLASLILMTTQLAIGLTSVVTQAVLTILYNLVYIINQALKAVGRLLPTMLASGFSAFVGGLLQGFVDILDAYNLGWVADALGIRKAAKTMMDAADSMIDSFIRSGENVRDAVEEAMENVANAVSIGIDGVNAALTSSLAAIDTAATGMLVFAEGTSIGANMISGMIEGLEGLGGDVYNATSQVTGTVVDAAEDVLGINSPSKVFAQIGRYTMEGLREGIQNEKSATESAMAEVINNSLQMATDILDGQEGDDYTIKVGMDISSVEAQSSRIQDIMSGVNNPSITASGRNAGYNASRMEKNNRSGEPVTDDHSTTVTYNNTFNIESTDPQQSADEIDKVLKEQNTRFKLAHGT